MAGRLVKRCEARGQDLSSLTLADLQEEHPACPEPALRALDPAAAAERRTSPRGPAWSEVAPRAALLGARLGQPNHA